MAVKGSIAKTNVINKLIETFGADYIGEFDGKQYIWADDGGNRVQISIALTCPKVLRGIEETGPAVLNFEDDEPAAAGASGFKPADITAEEKDTLAALMLKLGL